MVIVKIGSVELTEEEVKALYEAKKYICTYSGVYQIFYNENYGFSGQLIIHYKNLARRGRFYSLTAKEINKIIGKSILREDI